MLLNTNFPHGCSADRAPTNQQKASRHFLFVLDRVFWISFAIQKLYTYWSMLCTFIPHIAACTLIHACSLHASLASTTCWATAFSQAWLPAIIHWIANLDCDATECTTHRTPTFLPFIQLLLVVCLWGWIMVGLGTDEKCLGGNFYWQENYS